VWTSIKVRRSPVGERVVHEVHRPVLVGSRYLRACPASDRALATPRLLSSQRQAFLHVEPIHEFVIDLPAFSPKVGVEPAVAGIGPDTGQLSQTPAKRLVGRALAVVVKCRSRTANRGAGPPSAHLERLARPLGDPTAISGPKKAGSALTVSSSTIRTPSTVLAATNTRVSCCTPRGAIVVSKDEMSRDDLSRKLWHLSGHLSGCENYGTSRGTSRGESDPARRRGDDLHLVQGLLDPTEGPVEGIGPAVVVARGQVVRSFAAVVVEKVARVARVVVDEADPGPVSVVGVVIALTNRPDEGR
jgi:hypothetical protein